MTGARTGARQQRFARSHAGTKDVAPTPPHIPRITYVDLCVHMLTTHPHMHMHARVHTGGAAAAVSSSGSVV